MSTARSDLLIYVGVALSTTLGLFVLHAWYATYLDQRYHEQLAQHGPSEALLAAREEEQSALNAGKMPLGQAMTMLARPGARPASVSPAPSEDISAVSGWIHARGFKPATGHPVRVAIAPKPVAAQPAAEVPPAEPEPVAAPKPARPAPRQLKLKTDAVRPQVAH